MRRVLPVVLLALMVPSSSFALLPNFSDQNTLRGIKAVCVAAEVAGDMAQASLYGVTGSLLKSRVEGKLKEAGIRVAPLNECKRFPDKPFLHIAVVVILSPGLETYLLATVDFTFTQDVVLARDNTIKAFVPTWRNGLMIFPIRKPLLKEVTEVVDLLVEAFSVDYFAVNR